jgi:hypothetical protein
LKKLEFSIAVENFDGKFTVSSPELGISETSNSLDESYREIKKKISDKELVFRKIGIELCETTVNNVQRKSLRPFVYKWGGLCLTILLSAITTIVVSKVLFTQVFNHRYLRLERKILETIDPTPIKKEKRLKRFQENLKSATPYINETKKFIKNLDTEATDE